MQLDLPLTQACPPCVSSFSDKEGVGVHSFGKGFRWGNSCYTNFAASSEALVPITTEHNIERAVVPDLRGDYAYVYDCRSQQLIALRDEPRLFKTPVAVNAMITERGTSVLAVSTDSVICVLICKEHRAVAVINCRRISVSLIRKTCTALAHPNPKDVLALLCSGSADVVALVTAQLQKCGIHEIYWDGVDTRVDSRLNSRYHGSGWSNCTLVDMSKAFT